MDELLVGHEGGNKEVGDQQERPHLNLLSIEDCARPTTTNKYEKQKQQKQPIC